MTKNMDWSNDMVLEFLQVYETEPVIWDPRNENYKKKNLLNEAWHRIQNSLSWECSVEELKRKKDSLMAYYRIHLRKFKDSIKSGAEAEELYKTNWFAFSTMDSFLGPIYECSVTINTETSGYESYTEQSNVVHPVLDLDNSTSSHSTVSTHQTSVPLTRVDRKRKYIGKLPSELVAAKQESESPDEYELFGKLIASKIRKIQDPLDREILMNDINNLMFEAVMKSTASSQDSSTEASPPYEFYDGEAESHYSSSTSQPRRTISMSHSGSSQKHKSRHKFYRQTM